MSPCRKKKHNYVVNAGEEAVAWSEESSMKYAIFQLDHMITAGPSAESIVNPHPATGPSTGHHGISPCQQIYNASIITFLGEEDFTWEPPKKPNTSAGEKTPDGTTETPKGTLLSMPSAPHLNRPPFSTKFFLSIILFNWFFRESWSSDNSQ